MKRVHRTWIAGTVALLFVLILAAGCYRPVTTSVTPTPAGEEAQSVPSDEGVIATAKAEATRASETATARAAQGDEEPTVPAPTQEPPEAESDEPVDAPEPTVAEEQPTAAPPPEPTATPQPATTTGSGIHVVQAGENLYRIALRYGVTVDSLAAANGISDPGQIYVGQKLVIPTGGTGEQPEQSPPGATTYVVKPGDNLFRIAQSFKLTTKQLADYNGISDPNQIYVGQVLQIPPQ